MVETSKKPKALACTHAQWGTCLSSKLAMAWGGLQGVWQSMAMIAHHAAQSSPDGPGRSDLCQYVCETNSKPAGNGISGWTER